MLGACVVAPDTSETSPAWSFDVAPKPGASSVSRLVRATVQLDRRVFPQGVEAGVWLQSGASIPLVDVEYDPVDRRLHVQPLFPLLPRTAYTLFVEGLEDLDGRSQPEDYRVSFATGEVAEPPDPEVGPGWDEIAPLFRERCASPTCHGGDVPAAGLNLASAAGIEATAIGALSRALRAGTIAPELPRGIKTLAGLPLIDRVADRGRIGSSYLLYKVLGDPHVLGEPMPPTGSPLRDAEVALIRDWIRVGAPTR